MDRSTDEATAFKAFERDGWSEKAASYGLLIGRITRRLAEPLPGPAAPSAGARMLNLVSGPAASPRGLAGHVEGDLTKLGATGMGSGFPFWLDFGPP
jgi:hypothetical protein